MLGGLAIVGFVVFTKLRSGGPGPRPQGGGYTPPTAPPPSNPQQQNEWGFYESLAQTAGGLLGQALEKWDPQETDSERGKTDAVEAGLTGEIEYIDS
jgi:hypothetical protein